MQAIKMPMDSIWIKYTGSWLDSETGKCVVGLAFEQEMMFKIGNLKNVLENNILGFSYVVLVYFHRGIYQL